MYLTYVSYVRERGASIDGKNRNKHVTEWDVLILNFPQLT